MITAVVGTNVFLRGAISGSRRSASKDLLNAFFAGRFVLLLSSETFEEIQRVLAQDDVRAMHGWTDEKLLRFCRALEVRAKFREPAATVPASLTRDETDTKWVALALAGNADYLVTLDTRYLQRLKKVGRTQIVRLAVFLRAVKDTKDG